jgi:mycothiol synthase
MSAPIQQERPNLVTRPPRIEDAEVVADLMRACDVAAFGQPDTDVADVRDDWTAPGFELVRDAWFLEGPDGTATGFASVFDRAPGLFDGGLYVRPGASFPALGAVLLPAIEARAQEKASGKTASLSFFVSTGEPEMREFLEARGYRQIRTYFRMRIDLPRVAPASEREPQPSGQRLEIRPHRLGIDDRAMHAAVEESFSEHFRHTHRAFEEWWALRSRHQRFDPALWVLAWDQDRVAGVLTAYDFGDTGFIRELGVLKPWRGKGLGSALLERSFESFRARGQGRVALGVDAENENAIGLYTRIGMRVDSRHHLLERRLGA